MQEDLHNNYLKLRFTGAKKNTFGIGAKSHRHCSRRV